MEAEKKEAHVELLVRIGAVFSNKEDAIREACRMLGEAGCVDMDYAESMFKREYVCSTYLDRGLTIPHGIQSDMARVKHDGIAVLQVPQGVSWGPDQKAELIVAIAASSDAHLGILRRLVSLLKDEAFMEKLKKTSDEEEIKRALTEKPDQKAL